MSLHFFRSLRPAAWLWGAFLAAGTFESAGGQEKINENFWTEITIHPPEEISEVERTEFVNALRWQETQCERFSEDLHTRLALLRDELSQLDEAIQQLESQAPVQFRYLDQAARSQLATKCVEQMLEAQVELDSNLAIVEVLSQNKKPNVAAESRMRILQTELANAEAKLEYAKRKLDVAEKLRANGNVSEEEILNAQAVEQDAQTQLSILKIELNALADAQSSPGDDRLAELAVRNAALKAKGNAAERFLGNLSRAGDFDKELRSLQSRRRPVEDSLLMISRELEQNESKRIRFQMWRKLYESNAAKPAEKQ